MATQVRDNILAVTINGTGSTHYRIAHDANLASVEYETLPLEDPANTYLVRHDLPTVPGNYTLSVQLKNSLHESSVLTSDLSLLSNINPAVSTLRNKLRIAQSFGPNADKDTYCDEIKCFHSWISLYNNSETNIDLANVAVWTRWQDATSINIGVDPAILWATNPTVPNVKIGWNKTVLSGTIAPNSYFLILGPRVPTEQIVQDGKSIEQIKFTTDAEGADTFHVDLDLSLSTDFYISSKYTEMFLSDASLVAVPEDIYSTGALCANFIDLYGATANTSTIVEENFLEPQCIYNYFGSNSKQQVKTIVDPTIEASANLTDYTAKSIKSATAANIRTLAWDTAKPRNSVYVKALV